MTDTASPGLPPGTFVKYQIDPANHDDVTDAPARKVRIVLDAVSATAFVTPEFWEGVDGKGRQDVWVMLAGQAFHDFVGSFCENFGEAATLRLLTEAFELTKDYPTPNTTTDDLASLDAALVQMQKALSGAALERDRGLQDLAQAPLTSTHGSALPPQVTRFDDSQRRTLDAFAAKLRQEWRHLPATDRRLDTAQRILGIRQDDLIDYLLGLKEPDLAHLILLSDYCGCHAVDLWPTAKEARNGTP